MTITDLQHLYSKLPQAGALIKSLEDETIKRLFLQGLVASSASMLFSSIAEKLHRTIVFILNDADEAGYFYNDLNTTVEQTHQKDVSTASFSLPAIVELLNTDKKIRLTRYCAQRCCHDWLQDSKAKTKETPITLCLLLHIHRLFLSWWCRRPI